MSLEEMKFLFLQAPLAMFILEQDYSVSMLNNAARSMSQLVNEEETGHTPGEILRCIEAVEHPDGCGSSHHCDECLIRVTIKKTFSTRTGQKNIVTSIDYSKEKKTRTLWLKLSSSFLPGAKGDKMILSLEDISKEKKVEQTLKESERRYSRIFMNNHSIMLLLDPLSGEILDANPAALKFYGWNLQEMRQLKIQNINSLTDKELNVETKIALEEKKNHFFFKHKLANGSIKDVEVYSGPVLIGEKNVLLSIIHDISDRILIEQEKEKLIGELQKALKDVKILSGFIPICAHCKKIRDDKGFWNNLEIYFEEHSSSQFSHGLCPECAEELYGDQEWFKAHKNKN
jgi:PAS domain S-box-containing protein